MNVLIFRFNEAPIDNMFLELFELLKQAKKMNKVRVVMNFLHHWQLGPNLFEQVQLQAARLREYGGGIVVVSSNKTMRDKLNYYEQLDSLLICDSEDQALDIFARGLRYANS